MHTGTRAFALLIALLTAASSSSLAAGADASKDRIERGRYLMEIAGCHDCHSPKIFKDGIPHPDPSRLLSGHPAGSKLPPVDERAYKPGYWILMSSDFTAFVGAWGVTFAANLTPDDQTGIGLWTEDHFIKALRTGKHMGEGRDIMPPMPWPNLVHATDEDLKAIFAYLKSLPPIKNSVPAPAGPRIAAKAN